jgi:hypothetical protein
MRAGSRPERRLRRGVMLGMAGAGDQAAEAQPIQQGADAALVQGDVELGLDLADEIHPAPAVHAVLDRVGTTAHPVGDLAFLFRGEAALGAEDAVAVGQAGQALIVIAMHPVAQCLAVHAGGLGRLGARGALEDKRQGQHAARCGDILGAADSPAKPGCIKVGPGDADRCCHGNRRAKRREGQRIRGATISKGNSESVHPAERMTKLASTVSGVGPEQVPELAQRIVQGKMRGRTAVNMTGSAG